MMAEELVCCLCSFCAFFIQIPLLALQVPYPIHHTLSL
jgi:hypothetical protein